MNNDFIILESTNFTDGYNATALAIVRNINEPEELRPYIEHEYKKMKQRVFDDLQEFHKDDTDFNIDDCFSEDVSGLKYKLTTNDVESEDVIYEVYAMLLPKRSVIVSDIEWDDDDENQPEITETIVHITDYEDDCSVDQEIGDALADGFGCCPEGFTY